MTFAQDEDEAEDDLTPEDKKLLKRAEEVMKQYFDKRVSEGADPEDVVREAEAYIEASKIQVTTGVKPGKS
jgi:ketol-acid reductoisomerase